MRAFINIVETALMEGILHPYTGPGPLWHGTDLLALPSILHQDFLYPSIDAQRTNREGVSLTTNAAMAWSFGWRSTDIFDNNHFFDFRREHPEWSDIPRRGCVLELDADRLRVDYRLVHYFDDDIDDEDEVRALGKGIRNLSRYLVSFSFDPADAEWFATYMRHPEARHGFERVTELPNELQALVHHPLFRPA